MIFQRFRDYQLYVNLKKCEFFIIQIEFLNFIIFIEKINMNRKKIRMIKKWFESQTFREFQMFLKFVNFYRKFIHRYFAIVAFFIDFFKNNKKNKKWNLNNRKFTFFQINIQLIIAKTLKYYFYVSSMFCRFLIVNQNIIQINYTNVIHQISQNFIDINLKCNERID